MKTFFSIDSSQDTQAPDQQQAAANSAADDQLINLDAPENNFTINDIDDADFDPRAGDSDSSDDFNSRFNNVHINNTPVNAAAAAVQINTTPAHMVGITPPPAFPPPPMAGGMNNNNNGTPAPVKPLFNAVQPPPPAIPPRESKNPFSAGFGGGMGGGSADPFGMSSFNANEQVNYMLYIIVPYSV